METCFQVQICGTRDLFLVPADAKLYVSQIKTVKEDFPHPLYEDVDLPNQPTEVECNTRRDSVLSLSSGGSLQMSQQSSASSIHTSHSSVDGQLRKPHIAMSKCKLLFNPQRACTARVMVVAVFVCLSVCVSVCLVTSHHWGIF